MRIRSAATHAARAAALAGLIGALSTAATTTANAAPVNDRPARGVTACSNNVVGGPNNSSGYIYTSAGSPFRKGPGEGYCSYGNRSGQAALWCQGKSSAGNVWYLARDVSSGVVGWVWAGNVYRVASSNVRRC